jgi:GAF domain-containing protein
MSEAKDLSSDQDLVQNVSEQVDFLNDAIANLFTCVNEQQVLDVTVNSIRKAVRCDRAVIYNLQSLDRGKIVAESVIGDYPKTINTTITDPCFEARYIDKYQMGRVRAISNIYQAGLSNCYVENLEKISVKANLVVPILNSSNQLYGLLVLHQCSATREWQSAEIDLTVQMAVQLSYALLNISRLIECEQLRTELEEVKEWRKLQPGINRKLYTGRNRLEVLQIAVSITRHLLKCDRVVVYSLQSRSLGKIIAEVTQPALQPIFGRTIVDPCFENRYIEKYQNGRVRAINNVYTAGISDCYLETLNKIGVKSSVVTPILFDNGKLAGLLVAHTCFEFREWRSIDVEIVQQIAMQTGLAVTSDRIYEEQAVLNSATENLIKAENNIQSALNSSTIIQPYIEEIYSLVDEMHNLIRLLDNGVREHTTAEALELAKLIAKRQQKKLDLWQVIFKKIDPELQQITKLLQSTLTSIILKKQE